MKLFSRRDFLKGGWKFLEATLASALLPHPYQLGQGSGELPNIILLVCDAMSARNLSLYGYPRRTTPNLEKLAERAIVYHRHYANGNFTTPGTSSLLTGLHPWTHRAVNLSGIVGRKFEQHNIFRFLGDSHFKLAFTQNLWANYLLEQFAPDIHTLLPISEFGLLKRDHAIGNDPILVNHARERMLYYNNSLLLSFLYGLFYQPRVKNIPSGDHHEGFPIAQYYDYPFRMEDLFDGITAQILDLERNALPHFSYFHIYPPHHPYAPTKRYLEMFTNDGYTPVEKHVHTLAEGDNQPSLNAERTKYDAFIANLDAEIGRMIETLEAEGALDNTYFVLTSDHGEMFERGIDGHVTPLLYEPVIQIPLVILEPGNPTRRDVTIPTRNIDLLPTILNLAGAEIPPTVEGRILPGLGGDEDLNRPVFIMEAKESAAHSPFTKATYAIIKGNYKLIYYHGYTHKYQDHFEFYDLGQDAEELQDKYSQPRFASIVADLKRELLDAIDKADKNLFKDNS